jgi:hypothetical protein
VGWDILGMMNWRLGRNSLWDKLLLSLAVWGCSPLGSERHGLEKT